MNSEHLYKCYVNMLGEKEVTLKQLLILHGMLYILYAIVYYAKVYSHSSHLLHSATCMSSALQSLAISELSLQWLVVMLTCTTTLAEFQGYLCTIHLVLIHTSRCIGVGSKSEV